MRQNGVVEIVVFERKMHRAIETSLDNDFSFRVQANFLMSKQLQVQVMETNGIVITDGSLDFNGEDFVENVGTKQRTVCI